MGKSKRNRPRGGGGGGHQDPMGKKATTGGGGRREARLKEGRGEENLEEEEEKDATDELVQRIKSQLLEASAETKELGLQSLALLVDRQSNGAVIGSRLVRVAAPLMAEVAHPEVRHAAIGALRNLSLVSPEVCDEMVNQDVMTPLCAALSTFASADWKILQRKKKKGDEDRKADNKPSEVQDPDEVTDNEILVEAVGLLWNLCEASETALEVCNREGMHEVLLRNLDRQQQQQQQQQQDPPLPAATRLCLMQCLYSVTENNPAVRDCVRQNAGVFESVLAAAKEGGGGDEGADERAALLYAQVLSLGILINVEGFQERIWPTAVDLLARVLSVDHRKLANSYTSACPFSSNGFVPAGAEDGAGERMETEEVAQRDHDSLREELNHVVLSQQTALEILANACCGDEVEDAGSEWMEEDEEESGQSEDNVSLGSGPCSDEGNVLSLPPLLLQLFQTHDIVQLVLTKARLPAENVVEILASSAKSQGRMLLKMLRTLRSRALLCLSNLAVPLSADDLGGPEEVFAVWAGLGKLCFGDGDGGDGTKEDSELLDAVTAALRALTRKMAEGGCAGKVRGLLGDEDLHRIVTFGTACTNPKVRANMVHVVGDLGAILAAAAEEEEEGEGTQVRTATAANFLLEAASKDAHLRVVAEALDKIFDLFAEDTTDGLARRVSLVPRLKGLLPGLRAKMGTQRKTVGEESYSMAVMAKTNLNRFIKYKEKRMGSNNGHR